MGRRLSAERPPPPPRTIPYATQRLLQQSRDAEHALVDHFFLNQFLCM